MNENELNVVREYKFDNPLLIKIDFIIVKCYRDFHNSFFHTFKYEGINDNKFTTIIKNETIILTISDKSMNLYGIKKIKSC